MIDKTTSTESTTHLKRNSKMNETNNNPSLNEPKQQPSHSKNAEMVSMKTLENFGEQLKIELDTNLIHEGML